MYFEIEDDHPDITPVGSVMSWREGVLLSLVVHLIFVILALTSPNLFRVDMEAIRKKQEAMNARLEQDKERERAQFVFVEPKVDLWGRVLRRQPSELAFFATWSDNPELN